jgi:peptide/nickel transport system substrate-binding protein
MAVAVGLSLGLVACSGGGSSSTTGQTGTAGDAGSIDRDGVVRVGYDLVQSTDQVGFQLDPARSFNQNDAIPYLIYGRLMRPLADGSLEPDLAKSAEVTSPTTITIVVRDGITWHDGAPFDAASVKAGLDRTLAEADPAIIGDDFFELTSVTVVDPATVQLTIADDGAPGWFDAFMGTRAVTIVKPGTDFSNPVGAGPMKVASYEQGQSLDLERWDGYWNADAVNFAGMEFVNISTDSAQSGTAALQAGQIDITLTYVSQLPALTGDLEQLTIADPNKMTYVMICKKDGPLADARVRQALNKAVDRDALNAALFDGTAVPSTELWPEGNRFYTESVGDVLAYDQEEAKSLLAEAGYPDGFTVDLTTLGALDLPAMAEVLQQQWAEIGVDANIDVASNFVEDYLAADKPGLGLIPGTDPGRAKIDQWVGQTLGNICKYSDPELDKLFADLATVSESSDEAKQMWDRVNEISTEDALSVFLTFSSKLGAYDSSTLHVEDVWPNGQFIVPDIYSSYMLG